VEVVKKVDSMQQEIHDKNEELKEMRILIQDNKLNVDN
jgi:hypothetical protein